MPRKNEATLTYQDKKIILPVEQGTEGETAVNISQLRSKTGLITLDPGYGNTGSTKSDITFIDGEKGILRYRGYDIADLSNNCSFIEVTYLLIFGELPSAEELAAFTTTVTRHTMINEDYKKYYDVWPRTAHPMALLAAGMAGMSSFYDDIASDFKEHAVDISTIRCLAKVPTLAAYAYKKSIGQPFVYPRNELNYCQNFLNMMFSVPAEEYEVIPEVEEALNKLLILHADHEQNCSTSTVRMVGSSGANIYASIATGILALWGPLHGGANQAVLEMLTSIQKEKISLKEFVNRVKRQEIKLMGFGHRVYRNHDPRCAIIKKACDKLLLKLKVKDPLLDIAKELEHIALNDSYFIDRKLYPNVDFYSGIIYKAMNIPTNMFTVIFSIGRLPGWIAQWREMRTQGIKINRPRQIYTGSTKREFKRVKG
ncbi:MAG: citrate synthase [SAR324 cluster bacterium]|nr:citrate synthase [SAR324 cluster bacterium]